MQRWLLRRHLCRPDQPFDFAALRCIWRETLQELLGGGGCVGGTAGACECDGKSESRLMQIRIDRQRALEGIDGVGRMAAIGKHEAEIREHDRVSRFDPFGIAQRGDGGVELTRRHLARGKSEVRISGW